MFWPEAERFRLYPSTLLEAIWIERELYSYFDKMLYSFQRITKFVWNTVSIQAH